jgi:hypothetical protein
VQIGPRSSNQACWQPSIELAEAVAPVARLVGLAEPLAPRRPQAGADEPLAERLAADSDAVQLEQLLVGEPGAEVGVALAEERDRPCPELLGHPPVAGAAALLRHEPCGPVGLVRGAQPLDLALRHADERAGLGAGQPAVPHALHDVQPIDLGRAHRDQLRRRHRAAPVEATPSRAGATFLTALIT